MFLEPRLRFSLRSHCLMQASLRLMHIRFTGQPPPGSAGAGKNGDGDGDDDDDDDDDEGCGEALPHAQKPPTTSGWVRLISPTLSTCSRSFSTRTRFCTPHPSHDQLRLVDMFRELDKDQSGTITREELRKGLQVPLPHSVPPFSPSPPTDTPFLFLLLPSSHRYTPHLFSHHSLHPLLVRS
jgi:hypothetical protein